MPDETNPIDPGELAILHRAKADADAVSRRVMLDLDRSGAVAQLASAAAAFESSGLSKVLRDMEKAYRPQMEVLQDTLKRVGEQSLKLDHIAAYKPVEMPAIRYLRPTQDYILEATRQTSSRLDDVVEVLRETAAIQKTQVESLAALYVSMDETTKLTRSLLRWAPWAVAVGFGAMLAGIAAVVVPLFT